MTEHFEDQGYECVDPDLGQYLPLLNSPELQPDLRRTLEAHVAVCDDCRLRLDLAGKVAAKIQQEGAGPGRADWFRWVTWGGGGALAAGLALLMWLPPQARDGQYQFRSSGVPVLSRPVEGELIASGRPHFQWRAVDGATSYHLVIQELGGTDQWEGRTSTTQWSLPAGEKLPSSHDFRATLQTTPADLAPSTGFNVSFRTGSWFDWAAQRLRRGNRTAGVIGSLGALLSLLGLGLRWRGR